eukprot:TRINITY_DN35436_c0_g1_i6.p1 TRINITY_DN35436_c0_g1~~TRINITY_DN35436_c0_g1_i6.p1  ORF type:complete len:133 (+),score=25.21 TRINITY_DN35436_c0_g1_i6:163-561(+)
MASLPFPAPNSPVNGRDAVYVAALPLRATKGPAQMLMTAAYSLNFWDLQHYLVIIRPSSPHSQAFAFDFQPQDPESLYVALAAISRRPVPGLFQIFQSPTSPCLDWPRVGPTRRWLTNDAHKRCSGEGGYMK